MANYTSNYNLEKPLQDDFYNVEVQNSNMDKIDVALNENAEAANDHIANKKSDVIRMYLPPDTNCLLSCYDHCIRSKNYVNALSTR